MAEYEYDFSKLKGKIKELFGTQEAFANAMGISPPTMSYKLNGVTEWTQDEIVKAIKLLNIPPEEIHVYFFTQKVEKNSTLEMRGDKD